MTDALDTLADTLLYEGYSLYPYTPGASKNATPTPFGIVYPPRYAAQSSSTFDHLELRCVIDAPAEAILEAETRFLAADGERHRARPRRIALPPATLESLAARPIAAETQADGAAPLQVWLGLSARRLASGEHEVALRIENRTRVPGGLDRAGALASSLLSTLPIVRTSAGRFRSPLERACESVNTFPVLASAGDEVVLGAAIVLPDHPQIAAESRGGLFDSTEIEEALLLHVLALSDGEREQIARDDPVVREMVDRAAAATPTEIVALHGRLTLRDPDPPRPRESTRPPEPAPGLADPTRGEERAEVDGVTFRRGGKVVIRPPAGADLHARLLDGRTATIERIFVDYDGRAHLGVTIDGDPGQELMRETARYLFFFAPELEVVEP